MAAEPQKFLTKHALDSIRYISLDGRVAYVKKRPGVLGLVSYFKSVDFLSEPSESDFKVTASKAKQKIVIEVIRNHHSEYNFFKDNKILVGKYGDTQFKELGMGQNVKLHLDDEWISFYSAYRRAIIIQNIQTSKKFEILLSDKNNQFFVPDVQMVSSDTIVYTDINDKGLAAALGFNLLTQKSLIIYKATQNGTRMELCHAPGYLAIGEFPYAGVTRSSQILQVKMVGGINLTSYSTLYNSVDLDLGNMVCQPDSIYFVKTMNQDKRLTIKTTEAVKLDLKTQKLQTMTSLNNVTQIIEMDGRVMVPLRGDFFVLEGDYNLSTDTLKSTPNAKEELPLEI